MALYEITQDCRIANNDYQKGDIVSDNEVGGFYPTVMKPTNSSQKKVEIKQEKIEAPKDEKEEVAEVEKKSKSKWKKK